jgi:hypothetical protein
MAPSAGGHTARIRAGASPDLDSRVTAEPDRGPKRGRHQVGTLHGQIVSSDFLARHPAQPGQKSIFDMLPPGGGAEEGGGEEEEEEEEEGGEGPVPPRDELAALLGTLCSQIVSSDFLGRNPARGESIFTHADPMLAAEEAALQMLSTERMQMLTSGAAAGGGGGGGGGDGGGEDEDKAEAEDEEFEEFEVMEVGTSSGGGGASLPAWMQGLLAAPPSQGPEAAAEQALAEDEARLAAREATLEAEEAALAQEGAEEAKAEAAVEPQPQPHLASADLASGDLASGNLAALLGKLSQQFTALPPAPAPAPAPAFAPTPPSQQHPQQHPQQYAQQFAQQPGAVAVGPQARRVAPDGGVYTQAEFRAYFGGLDEWQAAPEIAPEISPEIARAGAPQEAAAAAGTSLLHLLGLGAPPPQQPQLTPPPPPPPPPPPAPGAAAASQYLQGLLGIGPARDAPQPGLAQWLPGQPLQQPALVEAPQEEEDFFAVMARQTQEWQNSGRR